MSWTDSNITNYCLTEDDSSANHTWTRVIGTSITPSYTLSSGDETKTVNAYIKNGAGDISLVKTNTIVLDTTAPVINNVTQGKSYFIINVSAIDKTSGIQTYYYQIDDESVVSSPNNRYKVSVPDDEFHTIKVYVKDAAGNISETSTITARAREY